LRIPGAAIKGDDARRQETITVIRESRSISSDRRQEIRYAF
jgi:hypothetical protein